MRAGQEQRMPSSRSVAVRITRSSLASSSTLDRIGIVVFFSTTPCERLSSRTRSALLTLNSIDLRSLAAEVARPFLILVFYELYRRTEFIGPVKMLKYT